MDIFLYPGEPNPNDVRLRDPTSGGGTTIPLGLSDSIALSDSLSNAVGLSQSDSVALSEAIIKSVGLSKADTIILSDVISKSFGLSKTDSTTLSEVILNTIGKLTTDSVILSDSLAKVMGLSKSDSIALSDLLSKGINLNEADAIIVSDQITVLKPLILTLSDTITLSDNADLLLVPGVSPTPIFPGGGGSTKENSKDVSLQDVIADEDIIVFTKAFLHVISKH